jgi:hypothetical protein
MAGAIGIGPENNEIRSKQSVMSMTNTLSSKRSGRVLLHLVCLVRRPDHAGWHWQGVVRELSINFARGFLASAVCTSFRVAVFPTILALLLACRELRFLLV